MNEETSIRQSELFDPQSFGADAFLTPAQIDKIERGEIKNDFIAARLKRKRPETYALIVMCRANGWTIKRTMQIANVGFNTVVDVDRAEADFIKKSKDAIAKESYGMARMIIDSMRDLLPAILQRESVTVEEAKGLTDILSKLVTNANLLSGEATEILGEASAPKYTGWRQWENAEAVEIKK